MAAGVQRNPAISVPRYAVETAIDLLERVPRSVHQFLFRLTIASVFLPAGLLKLASWESTIELFQDEYKVPVLAPAVAAVMATTFELVCSALLIVGLATRLATLPLLGQILTIQLFVHPQAWHEHFVWGSILLVLLTRGAGPSPWITCSVAGSDRRVESTAIGRDVGRQGQHSDNCRRAPAFRHR